MRSQMKQDAIATAAEGSRWCGKLARDRCNDRGIVQARGAKGPSLVYEVPKRLCEENLSNQQVK